MAFKGKLAGVDGRRLLFGKKVGADGKVVLNDKGQPVENPPGFTHHENEFELKPGGNVLRGAWPDWEQGNLSDLRNGMEVKLHGVKQNPDGSWVGEVHSVSYQGGEAVAPRTHLQSGNPRTRAGENSIAMKAKAGVPVSTDAKTGDGITLTPAEDAAVVRDDDPDTKAKWDSYAKEADKMEAVVPKEDDGKKTAPSSASVARRLGVKKTKAELDEMTVADLREHAHAEGINLHGASTKDEIIHAVQHPKD